MCSAKAIRPFETCFGVERSTVAGVSLEDAAGRTMRVVPGVRQSSSRALNVRGASSTTACGAGRPTTSRSTVERRGRTRSRGWVIWHVAEHDVHHGGEISQILGSHGLAPLDV
jgi:hypothetical protein